MKNLVLSLALLAASVTASAQLTLEHSYPTKIGNASGIVALLSANGTKYVMTDSGSNQVKIYNTDHTLWKTINAPTYAGYTIFSVFALSDHLFNSDDAVELGVSYFSSSPYSYKGVLISETGSVIQDLGNVFLANVKKVDETFKLITYSVGSSYTYNVYSCPGTVPCNSCTTPGTSSKVQNTGQHGFIASPAPNPNSGEVKLFYKLPEGVSSGTITIINAAGQMVKMVTVDEVRDHITMDNAGLPAGNYQCILSGDGIEPVMSKMVIVR